VIDEDGIFADTRDLPFVTINEGADFSKDQGYQRLIPTLKEIKREFEEDYRVPLRLIIIDTMITAFAIENWNDPAQVTTVTNKLHDIAKQTGSAVMGIAHHGKDISRGVTGSFAQKANVDFLLSIYIKRANDNDPLSDVISRHIHLSKYRDGPEGWQHEFRLQSVPVGERRDGKTVFSAYVVPVEGGSRIGVMKKPKGDGRPLEIFKAAFTEATITFGELRAVRGNGPVVKMVRRDHARAEFSSRYTTDDGNTDKAKETIKKAFNRGIKLAIERWNLLEGRWNGQDWLWKV
jgi:hypothetical protein